MATETIQLEPENGKEEEELILDDLNDLETKENTKPSKTKKKQTTTFSSPDEMLLTDVPGLGPKTATLLNEAGIMDPAQLMQLPLSAFDEVGVTRTIAKKIRGTIVELFPNLFGAFHERLSLEDIEGIGPTTAKALRDKGMNFHLLESTPIRELEEVYGITPAAAQKYQSFISDVRGGWFTDAFSFMAEQKNKEAFTFGADSIDQLMSIPEIGKSGVIAGETYEFFGAFRSGKSQICHQLCITVQLPKEMGGLGKKAIYLDTEGTFSPTRLTHMINRLKREKGWDKDNKEILADIMYARIKNSDNQQAIVYKLLEFLGEHPDEYGLLVIDSISSHFRAEYSGRGTLAERQQTLNGHLSILHRIADTYGLAIVITNQVQANPAQFFGDPTKAVGGNIMGHWAGTRVYLRKSKGEKRVFRIFDSPVLPELEAIFEITEDGVMTSE